MERASFFGIKNLKKIMYCILRPEMESTREKLLRATYRLMLEKGYDKVGVSDLQAQLNISRGLLYRYFKSKKDLVLEVCREFFYSRYFDPEIDYDKITLRQFLDFSAEVIQRIVHDGQEIEMLKYNTLYSSALRSDPDFISVAQKEFDKARLVIHNAIVRGEIKSLPENFVGATILVILGRTSYISAIHSNEYICKRIVEDVNTFYDLIKK